jgi:hypothetical protein
MEVKLLEVRDRGTFMPVMAVRLLARDDAERFLLRRAGYADDQIMPHGQMVNEPYVILVKLDGVEAQYDPFEWGTRRRSLFVAHQFVIANWARLQPGQVIDVEHILGESAAPKLSERVTVGDYR